MMTEDVWSLMMSTYLYERRRCRKQFEEIYQKTFYQMQELRNNKGNLRGFVGYWEIKNWIAIEHIAVQPNENFREVITTLLKKLKTSYKDDFTIIKEIDILSNSSDVQEKEIFSNAGFLENPFVYIQPSFHKECANFPQRIMSYPSQITYVQFKELRNLLYKYVYGKMKMC